MDPTSSEQAPGEGDQVLILAPTGRDGPLSARLLAAEGLPAQACVDAEALCEALARDRGCGALLLAQEALTAAAIARLGAALAAQPPWSDVPVVIILGAGELARAPVLPALPALRSLRGATYLERPVRLVTLVSALRAALEARRRQYELRDHLAERRRITEELQQANERLREADHRKDEFLALLGHELRNPLGAISNAAHLLSGAPRGPLDTARILAVIRRQTDHLGRLVDDLLEVSRVTAGKIALRPEPVELGELGERCRQVVAPAAEAQGHALRLRPAAAPLWTRGDPVRLEQIVVNLLSNAVKYTQPGGHIELALGAEGGQAVLRVRDDGLGIGAEMMPHLFEPFSQAPRTLDRAQGGLGIGLALVRSLVELHGGTVEGTSAGPGRGSEFVVRLPLAAPPEAPRPAVEAPQAATRCIVLIEDNRDLGETLQELLEAMGHEVELCEDGVHGVERVLARRPDVALIDIGLPGLDGYEVARRIRRDLADGVLLVALSGYGQPDDRSRSRQAGFDEHLTKPPSLEALTRLLAG